jgi:site-specific DNA recombinase
MARARIYIRRSDDDQSTYSPEAQERQDRLYCELHGHEVVKLYIDDDLSGTRENRARFQELLIDAKGDPGSLVVVHKIDRLARDAQVTLRTIKELDRHNVTLVSVSEQIDFSTPIGRVMLTNLAAFAEYYSRNLSTEVKKGLREKAAQGGWIGLPPLGYHTVYETAGDLRIPGSDRIEPSADRGTVELAFQLYATGNHSDLSVAEELNRQGRTMLDPKTGQRRPFQKDSVGLMLKNPAYIGIVRCGGNEYQGKHAPIVSRDLWDQVQAVRALRAKRMSGNWATQGRGGMLSEIAYCGHCGGVMHWHNHGHYWCSTRRKFGEKACHAPMVAAKRIEPLVLEKLASLSIPPDTQETVIQEVQRRLGRPPTSRSDTKTAHEQLRRLSVAYRMGDPNLTDEIFLREKTRLERIIAEEPAPTSRMLDLTKALELLTDMPKLIAAASGPQRRALVRQVFAQIWLQKTTVTAVKPSPQLGLLVEAIVSGVISTGIEPATFSFGG